MARWLVSLFVWFILATTAIATVGFAADGPPEGSPEWFGTAPSRVGDRGLYKTALVVVDGDDGEWFDLSAKYAFERVDDHLLPADGMMRPMRSFVTEWTTSPFEFYLYDFINFRFPDCFDDLTGRAADWSDQDWVAYAEEWEACGAELEAWGEAYSQQWADWSSASALEAWGEREHRVAATGWGVDHLLDGEPRWKTLPDAPLDVAGPLPDATWTVPGGGDGPCGFDHGLQGRLVDMWEPVQVAGTCPPALDLGIATTWPLAGPVTVRVSGEDRVEDWDTTVFSHTEDPDALRLWFTEDVAYPVRILNRVDVVPPAWLDYAEDVPDFYILLELIDYQAGDADAALTPVALPGMSTSARAVWGAPDSGTTHPWPLSQAFTEARSAPNSELEAWLRQHPDAAVNSAHFTRQQRGDPEDPVIDETWTFSLANGTDGLDVVAQRHTETTLRQPLPGLPGTTVREPRTTVDTQQTSAQGPGADRQPDQVPTVAAAQAWFAGVTGTSSTGWAYGAACAPTCGAWLTVGTDPARGDPTLDLWTFDAAGRPAAHIEPAGTYPEPRFEDDPWDPSDAEDDWGWHVAGAGVWNWPTPKSAAGAVAATGAIGLLYFLWPLLKGMMPLFSRIRREDLLDHPVRNDIFQAIEGRPGIHFQELVRTLGKSRGTMEHHLRKMVAAELVVEKSGRGFTCYFPHGAVDRRIMQAAPALKSAGARQVLQAVAAQPGTVAADVADRLGMAPSTVNYHLKKLVAAELVAAERNGRTLALHATPLADQALGTLVQT